jgi:hypothetical protein
VLPESLRPEDRRRFTFARASPLTPFLTLRNRMLIVLTAAALCDQVGILARR